jgi:thiol-disulfide isomerase/thioredoxin
MFWPEVSLRTLIVGLLGMTLAVAGCDRHGGEASQGASAANTISPDEAPAAPAPDSHPADKLDRSHKGEAAPTSAFTAPDGKQVTLASFKGKRVLVNLWATWCGPCVAEMPTLDTLAAREGGKLVVLPISQDMDGAAKVTPYWAKAGLKTLKPYLDPAMALSLGYKANLPTSILYGADGREVWRVTGSMDWTGDEAKRLVAEGA